ncbi:MAG: DNA (cytosine-5-)-methyltransferase, partial [Planctomycetales bacterium]|nr:DNA (cytosine-5-)-methyltransferase [Planctomycetales bacterium]
AATSISPSQPITISASGPGGPMSKTVCEFFAGIGLVHEGLRQGDWECIYAGDIDGKKKAMYEGHYGPSPHYHQGDVWNTEEVVAHIPTAPYLATASFPCTDMSLAGKRRGLAGEESSALLGFLRVIEQLGENQPRVVLLENVPGFLTSHKGRDFRDAVEQLADLGYWCDALIVDARWFVPQSRPRLFVVGYHDSLNGPPLVRRQLGADVLADPYENALRRADKLRPCKLLEAMRAIRPCTGWTTVDVANPPQRNYRLEDFLERDDALDWWDESEVERHHQMMSDRHRRQVDLLVEADEPAMLTGFRRVRHGEQRLEVRFDGIAGCLRTPRGGSAKQAVLMAGGNRLRIRWMTPREYSRLQGAGHYTLPPNRLQGLFGFGDAVCVPAIAWIDRHMLTPVYDQWQTADKAGPSRKPRRPVAASPGESGATEHARSLFDD